MSSTHAAVGCRCPEVSPLAILVMRLRRWGNFGVSHQRPRTDEMNEADTRAALSESELRASGGAAALFVVLGTGKLIVDTDVVKMIHSFCYGVL